MTPRTLNGAFKIFRVFGIAVYVHWTWFILVVFLFRITKDYTNPGWRALEILSIFAIVLLHEFGHALACKSVGGKAEHIMLWPLGGVAYVDPPHRPGAVLWSIVAGPLVNVLLAPVFMLLWMGGATIGLQGDAAQYVQFLFFFNLIILVFNLLPIYPLDGGQILQSLLWFVIGWSKSLFVTAGLGLVCGVTAIVLALLSGQLWWVVMGGFVAWQSFRGFQLARTMVAYERVYGTFDPHNPPAARRRYGPPPSSVRNDAAPTPPAATPQYGAPPPQSPPSRYGPPPESWGNN